MDGADADLRIGLTFAHPATAAEADFLFGSNSKGRGAKRKRGPAPVQLGGWLPPVATYVSTQINLSKQIHQHLM